MLRLASRNVWQQGEATRPGELAQEAIDILDGLDETVERGRAIVNLAGLRMVARADDEAVALAESALTIGERFHDVWTIANALITKGTALRSLGQRGEGTPLMQQGLVLAKEARLADVALRAYNNLLIGVDIDPLERERLLEEGLAYAERHGLEQPMLHASRSWNAYLRGDWDEALAVGDRVPEGSFWHDQVDGARALIALGRQGPDVALNMARRRAERALGYPDAQRLVPPLALMMFVCAQADERSEGEVWAGRLRERAEADPGVRRFLAGGPFNALLPAAAFLRQPSWIELVASVVPVDEAGDMARHLLDATRAFFARDAAVCGSAVAAYYRYSLLRRFGVNPGALVFAGELRRDGLALGSEWAEPLALLRTYLERARSDWHLGELAAIEQQIGQG